MSHRVTVAMQCHSCTPSKNASKHSRERGTHRFGEYEAVRGNVEDAGRESTDTLSACPYQPLIFPKPASTPGSVSC